MNRDLFWLSDEQFDRISPHLPRDTRGKPRVDDRRVTILGVEIPHICIPVRPGRNLGSIIEVAARNFLLKGMGYHSARDFQERLMARMDVRPLGDEVE